MRHFFKIYDTDLNEISLPEDDLKYGFRALDLDVTSIEQEVTEETIPGGPGNIIVGVRDADRDMTMKALIRTMNPTDYRLKRDRIYNFFSTLKIFYITESLQSNKLMRVRVVESYEPERPDNNQTFATVEIPLKIDGQPYWISRYKTMDLHENAGVPANGHWSFGMGIDVDPEKLKYQFENESKFDIYNAGKDLKTIQEKDNCEITIEINEDVTNFRMYDGTGNKWEYNSEKKDDWKIKKGDKITFDGHDVRLNKTTIMERTNRYYPVIKQGTNNFEIRDLNKFKITFDFRFKYY